MGTDVYITVQDRLNYGNIVSDEILALLVEYKNYYNYTPVDEEYCTWIEEWELDNSEETDDGNDDVDVPEDDDEEFDAIDFSQNLK